MVSTRWTYRNLEGFFCVAQNNLAQSYFVFRQFLVCFSVKVTGMQCMFSLVVLLFDFTWFRSDSNGKHTGPVWQLKWIEKDRGHGEEKTEVLVSVSTDGRVTQWSIRKGFESYGWLYLDFMHVLFLLTNWMFGFRQIWWNWSGLRARRTQAKRRRRKHWFRRTLPVFASTSTSTTPTCKSLSHALNVSNEVTSLHVGTPAL